MACSVEFIEFLEAALKDVGEVRSKKMFGDWLIYINDKPIITACDDMAFVKKSPFIENLMEDAECGCPYEGAKEHYILDFEHREQALEVVRKLVEVTPVPKKRKA